MQAKRRENVGFRPRALVIATVVTLLCAGFALAGRFLVVDESPVASDAIVVLGGGGLNRILRGVELFNEGKAPSLIVSGGNLDMYQYTEADVMASQAEGMGVPLNRIILENNSKTTYENALFTKKIVETRRIKSLIVVSSDYHMRRVQLVFSRVYRGTGVRLVFCSSPTPFFNPNRWWSNRKSIDTVVSEYAKILMTFIGLDR